MLYFRAMILRIFLPLLVLIACSCSNKENATNDSTKEVSTEINYQAEQIAFEDSIYKFRVELNYPVFESNNPGFETMLNSLIQEKIREYRSFEVEYRDNFVEMMASLGTRKGIGENDLIVNFRVIDSCSNVLSLIFEVGTFYMGSAQSTFFQDCFNFDKRDMSPIYASNIFGSTEDVLIPLTAMINEKVKTMDENQCEGLSGPEELYHFINNFNISPNGISFHFSDFSLCPFAGTDPSIFLKWDDIRSLTRRGIVSDYCAVNS